MMPATSSESARPDLPGPAMAMATIEAMPKNAPWQAAPRMRPTSSSSKLGAVAQTNCIRAKKAMRPISTSLRDSGPSTTAMTGPPKATPRA